jgi:pullulanase-type alpha-1,6-glucosidase
MIACFLLPGNHVLASDTPDPETVGLAGTHQDEIGCPGEWMPGCEETLLTYDPEDGVWQAEFLIKPANDDDQKGPRYKVALNGSWDENYGLNASRGGADIPLVVSEPTLVRFYYDHETHWITDSVNTSILVAVGDFQQQLGCAENNDAGCLRSWLQDPDGSGTFRWVTTSLKAGSYTVQLTKNEEASDTLGESQTFEVKADGDEIYFGYDMTKQELIISTEGAPKGSLAKQKAHWVSLDTVLWNVTGSPRYTYALYYSEDASLSLEAAGIANGTEIPLTYIQAGPGGDIFERFPHLKGSTTLKIDDPDIEQVRLALKGQLAILARDQNGKVVEATGVQSPGVIDAAYRYDGPLGVTFKRDIPSLTVWAPTAHAVKLRLFSDSSTEEVEVIPMSLDEETGAWMVTGKPEWNGQYYLYEVEVYAPSTGKIETNLVTDPYSFSLSTNSLRSQIINLHDEAYQPEGWDQLKKPKLDAPENIVIYELHVRDFSASDQSVPEDLRGTFMAFTIPDSDGMQHLTRLAKAGLTHIHLLPAFDFATTNEDKSTWQTVDEEALAALPPDSDQQAQAVSVIRGVDGFNWGYDPLHFTVPEGSYATNPDGPQRILEFRSMVQSLNNAGLRVVMDVVYNHTNASGQTPNSMLDRIVPGYYHRLDAEGNVQKSTCCQNTATEHRMMQRLMVDSVVTWATAYKVDGFRFDLMGHHMLADMQAVRDALDDLTVRKDGVDGKSIYVYGEGWDFGEVADNARGANASQLNIGGTGIGVFNDRLRDAARGGNPFDDPRDQGFVTGLFTAPSRFTGTSLDPQRDLLFTYTDWIRLGLSGNLSEYQLIRANGELVPGSLVLYKGPPAAYTQDPQENVVYVSAHDNETLFDAIQVKAPADATLADRVRMNNLAISLVMFSQGVPFFHAGDDLLRSKSLNPNSYDSGDWYNQLDWTYQSNNWGVGLPPEGQDKWSIIRPLLADPNLMPSHAEISFARDVFLEFLQIRKSAKLFRLETAEDVIDSVSFLNTGPDQIPGLIIIHLEDTNNRDPVYQEIVVLFNANAELVTFPASSLAHKSFQLHTIQRNSEDTSVRESSFEMTTGDFTIPSRTTAVFVIEDAPGLAPQARVLIGLAAAAVLGLAAFLMRRSRNRQ